MYGGGGGGGGGVMHAYITEFMPAVCLCALHIQAHIHVLVCLDV